MLAVTVTHLHFTFVCLIFKKYCLIAAVPEEEEEPPPRLLSIVTIPPSRQSIWSKVSWEEGEAKAQEDSKINQPVDEPVSLFVSHWPMSNQLQFLLSLQFFYSLGFRLLIACWKPNFNKRWYVYSNLGYRCFERNMLQASRNNRQGQGPRGLAKRTLRSELSLEASPGISWCEGTKSQ